MCTSRAEGGQRCYGDAKTALDNAHTKKVATEIAYTQATGDGAPFADREPLLRKAVAAEYAYQDALAEYASTKQGRADLETRLKTAPGYHVRRDPIDPHRPDDHADLTAALSEGQMLRARAAEIKRAVRAGEMTPEAAEQRAEYPNEFARAYRATAIDALVNRVRTREATQAATPAAPAATAASAEAVATTDDEALADAYMAWQGDGPDPDAAWAVEVQRAHDNSGVDPDQVCLECDRYGDDPDHVNHCDTAWPRT